MLYSYVFESRAQEEYETSLLWYLDRSLNAAQDFVYAVDETLKLICKHPERWRNPYRDFYELGLKKFPFYIIYTIDHPNKRVVVFSIYHQKRNPKRKYKSK